MDQEEEALFVYPIKAKNLEVSSRLETPARWSRPIYTFILNHLLIFVPSLITTKFPVYFSIKSLLIALY